MVESYFAVGIVALVFWSFQLAPQVMENWQRKSTKGLSPLLMLSWTLGSLATAIYNIGAEIGGIYSALFVLQPNLFMIFSIACCAQCAYYEINKTTGVVYGIGLIVLIGGFEALGGIFMRGISSEWPFLLLGSISLVFFAIGYIPQYITIFSTMRVEGVSLVFLSIDMIGSIFSIASLAMQQNFEPISGACYIVVFVLDLLIMVLYFILPSIEQSPISRPECSGADQM